MMRRLVPSIPLLGFLLVFAGPGGVSLPGSGSQPEVPAPSAPAVYTVFLDPGHGGADSGAIYRNSRGEVVVREKDVNLAVALKTAALLRSKGYRAVLSRETDERPGDGEDANGDGRISHRDNLQAVVDLANASGADLLISMHSNGARDPGASGVEVYYCGDRAFASESRRLAELVETELVEALGVIGYRAAARGVKDDSLLYNRRGRRGHLFVLGPTRTWGRRQVHPRATQMPGVLAEALFVSNGREAELLASESGQWALARGYIAAVESYLTTQ